MLKPNTRILRFDNDVDLVLTYSWSTNNHGICGHTYEVIDYYYILKDHFNVKILLAEDINWETFKIALEDKYNFTEDEIQMYKDNTVFKNRPILIKGNNILFTDGGVTSINFNQMLFKNIFLFSCGDKKIKNNNKENVYVLQDNRVYDEVQLNGINYKKKILFSKYKEVTESTDDILLYGTKNCRNIELSMYAKLLRKYSNDFIVLTSTENKHKDLNKRLKFCELPLKDLFKKFNTYIYTPVPRKFDCSPRFIAECKFYNKEVIYEIDYINEDKGLFYRKLDIDTDFESIVLQHDDELINILRNII